MTDQSRYEQGLVVFERPWGKSRAEKVEKMLEGFSPAMRQYVIESMSVYTNPALEPKIRSLCTISALTVLGRTDELRMHVVGALNNGATQDEVREVLTQMALYGGIPFSIGAHAVASKVFAEQEGKK